MIREVPASLRPFFRAKRWKPFPFQVATWQAYRKGLSGLVHASTGSGKTLALWLGTIAEYLDANPDLSTSRRTSKKAPRAANEPVRLLWITPMRALANDLVGNLAAPVEFFHLPWTVEARTGDTSPSTRRAQKAQLPTALVTTPESLTLLLTYQDWCERFASLQAIVVDEWHELLGSKRGVQTELAIARLRRCLPQLRVWGASATLGNLQEAGHVLCDCGISESNHGQWTLIADEQSKAVEIATVIPPKMERFPWAGHLGLRMLLQVVDAIESARTSLVFTNTRSQCEIWFRAILNARQQWAAEIAVHHGSLDRELRSYVESRLRQGTMRTVVCTSSLDLGVDFAPVDLVIQVGSPKGIGRLLQRAGRAGHQPGAVSRVLCVPTHAFELVEYAAARSAAERRDLEARTPVRLAMDVLVQHLVTVSLAGGFREDELLAEVRTTHAFRQLTDDAWKWAIQFLASGGPALKAYPQYAKLVREGDVFKPASSLIARLHRLSIGTISSDQAMQVKLLRGQYLGTIEESFIARLKPRDRFAFAGRELEFVQARDMTAHVRISKKAAGVVPRWDGGRFPVSTQLAAEVRRKLAAFSTGAYDDLELQAVEEILALQQTWSYVPNEQQVLFELSEHRGVHQAYLFPFEGRNVNEGIAVLVAHRISREQACSISITTNDYGFELLSSIPLDFAPERWRTLLSPNQLWDDLAGCLNATELMRRQFRDIARISGLVLAGYPGAPRSARQLQASSGLIYDVLCDYDAENMLLVQARREVLEQQLEFQRLHTALVRIADAEYLMRRTARLTPLAFPLWAARVQTTRLSSEKWGERVERMVRQLERAAG